MRQVNLNRGSGEKGLFNQLAAEKKKGVIAICLIALMVFMWFRAFGTKAPKSAGTAVMSQATDTKDKSASGLQISYVELPKVAGRNDELKRDFFDANGWAGFGKEGDMERDGGAEGVKVVSGGSGVEIGKRIAAKLTLSAIELSGRPKAFINGKLVSVGEKLSVSDGDEIYDCEVVAIEEHEVMVRCGEAEITLKLSDVAGIAN